MSPAPSNMATRTFKITYVPDIIGSSDSITSWFLFSVVVLLVYVTLQNPLSCDPWPAESTSLRRLWEMAEHQLHQPQTYQVRLCILVGFPGDLRARVCKGLI